MKRCVLLLFFICGFLLNGKTDIVEEHDVVKIEHRTWTALDGKTVDAQLVKVTSGMVLLKTPDKKEIRIRFNSLSKTDQDWIRANYIPEVKHHNVSFTRSKSTGVYVEDPSTAKKSISTHDTINMFVDGIPDCTISRIKLHERDALGRYSPKKGRLICLHCTFFDARTSAFGTPPRAPCLVDMKGARHEIAVRLDESDPDFSCGKHTNDRINKFENTQNARHPFDLFFVYDVPLDAKIKSVVFYTFGIFELIGEGEKGMYNGEIKQCGAREVSIVP